MSFPFVDEWVNRVHCYCLSIAFSQIGAGGCEMANFLDDVTSYVSRSDEAHSPAKGSSQARTREGAHRKNHDITTKCQC